MHSVLAIRPGHIIADELHQKEGRSGTVFILISALRSVRRPGCVALADSPLPKAGGDGQAGQNSPEQSAIHESHEGLVPPIIWSARHNAYERHNPDDKEYSGPRDFHPAGIVFWWLTGRGIEALSASFQSTIHPRLQWPIDRCNRGFFKDLFYFHNLSSGIRMPQVGILRGP